MTSDHVDSISEIKKVRDECLGLIDRILEIEKGFVSNPDSAEIVRLMAIPIVYSLWERAFTISTAICLKKLRDSTERAGVLSSVQRAVWLQKTNFFQSFLSKSINGFAANDSDRPQFGKGSFNVLSEFLGKLDDWHAQPLDITIDTESLLMTFSNVNKKVTELNAKAIGLSDNPNFGAIELAHLDELVGRRNDIGHGTLIAPPEQRQFEELAKKTRETIQTYCDFTVEWIEKFSLGTGASPASIVDDVHKTGEQTRETFEPPSGVQE